MTSGDLPNGMKHLAGICDIIIESARFLNMYIENDRGHGEPRRRCPREAVSSFGNSLLPRRRSPAENADNHDNA